MFLCLSKIISWPVSLVTLASLPHATPLKAWFSLILSREPKGGIWLLKFMKSCKIPKNSTMLGNQMFLL
jgi:hypothetical protein